MSDILEKIGDTLVNTGKEVSHRAKEITDKARIQYDIKKKEDFLRRRFEEIGMKYYEDHSADEEFADVTDAYDEIDELKEQLADIKGGIICPDCGKIISEDSLFCNYCGSSLEDPFEDELEQEIVDED